jgi:hypothetical protein
MIYKVTSDKTAKFLTIAVTLLFIGIAIGPKLFSKSENTEISIISVVVLFLIYGISYGLSPNSYEINDNSIVIKRLFKNVIVNRSQIKNVLKLESGKLSGAIRMFASGGLFGYFGTFWNKEFGTMTWYATRRDKAIMLITISNQKIILTPDETDNFLNEFST